MRDIVKRERDRSPSVEDAMKLQTRERERLPIAEEGRRREKERERETGSEQKTRVLDVNLVEKGERSPTVEDDRTMKKFKILDCEGAKEDMETEGNKGENDAASCDSQDQMLVETDSSVPAINVEKQSAATTPHKGIDASLNHGETVWNPDRLQGQLDVESSQNGIARATRAVMAEARSQQAASMTEFHWLGHRFPISNAKTRAAILKAQELEKDIHGPSADSIPADKRLATFDKIFSAYREARGYIRADLSTAGSAENVKDELYGVDKAVSSALGERTIERNLLLVKVAKSKLADENNEKVTKPEELVRLYDLLLQNTADLAGLVSTGRDKKPEEVSCAEDCASKTLAFRAERCFYVAKSYSMAEKRAEAYALYCRARDLAEDALRKLKTLNGNNQTMVKDLEGLCNESRSNSCIEHVSNMSWTVDEQLEKFLTEKLGVCASAVDVKRVAL